MKKVFLLAAALTLIACSSSRAQQAPGSEVAARLGDRVITMKELEDRWAAADPAAHADATQKLYDGRRAALDDIVAEALIAQAAKAKGQSSETYEQVELDRRVKPVTEADVVAFYQANANQMQGRTLDQVGGAIKRYLEDQQRAAARQDLVNELKKTAPALHVMLEAPRTPVAISATDPAVGGANAPITIVEFSDFQCPYCQRAWPTLKKIREAYGDKVRVVWKDFPLTQIHPQAFKAAEAAHCAEEQGKFWEFHDRMFSDQSKLQPDDLKKSAADMGLDATKFNACLDSSKYAERVRDGVAAGTRLGVNSTPTLYINGRLVQGAQPYENFASIINEELDRTGKK